MDMQMGFDSRAAYFPQVHSNIESLGVKRFFQQFSHFFRSEREIEHLVLIQFIRQSDMSIGYDHCVAVIVRKYVQQ
jgi:hypothetical protein